MSRDAESRSMRTVFCTLMLLTSTVSLARDDGAEQLTHVPRAVDVVTVTSRQLQAYMGDGRYVRVARSVLSELLDRIEGNARPDKSGVRKAIYHATLDKDSQMRNGRIELQLDAHIHRYQPPVLNLSTTNLDALQLYAEDRPLPLAADADGNLVPLLTPTSGRMTGSWRAAGDQTSATTVFQFKLPTAAVAEFHLQTENDTTITSPNALVTRKTTSAGTEWLLLPHDPSALLINCSRQQNPPSGSAVSTLLNTDVVIKSATAVITWQVTIPPSLTQSEVLFSVSRDCSINSISFTGADISKDLQASPSNSVRIVLPQMTQPEVVTISAVVSPGGDGRFDLPFLVAEQWKSREGTGGGPIAMRFGRFRLSVAAGLVLTDLQLNGVLENDVSMSADGIRTLELSQFARTASALASVIPADAVLADSVVIRPGLGADADKATAWIRVESIAGTAGHLHWRIPRPWRVTEVRELQSGLPTLFRMHDSKNSIEPPAIDVIPRTPVSQENSLTLVMTLQSTATGVTAPVLPALLNSGHHRQLDLLCLDATAKLSEVPWVEPERKVDHPPVEWLPQDVAGNSVFVNRPPALQNETSQAEIAEELVYSVDHSVRSDNEHVTEQLRLRVHASGVVPSPLILHATRGLNLSISDESTTQPTPLIRRIATGQVYDTWELEVTPGVRTSSTLDVILVSTRVLNDSLPLGLIALPDGRLSGGTIQLPAETSAVQVTHTSAAAESLPYPSSPFDGRWLLLRKQSVRRSLTTSGPAFVLLSAESGRVRADVLQQLAVSYGGSDSLLHIELPENLSPAVFVDGRAVYPERRGDTLAIPLAPDRENLNILLSYQVQAAMPDIDVPLAVCPESQSSTPTVFYATLPHISITSDNARPWEARTVLSVLDTVCQTEQPDGLDSHLYAARMRWQAAVLNGKTGTCLPVKRAAPNRRIRFSVSSKYFEATTSCLWLIGTITGWRVLTSRMRFPAWLLLLAVIIIGCIPGHLRPFSAAAWTGFTAGTLISWCALVIRKWTSRHRWPPILSLGKPVTVSTVLVIGLIVGTTTGLTIGADAPDRPLIIQVRTDGGKNEYLYVDADFLARLKRLTAQQHNRPLVVSSEIRVTLESPQSCLLQVSCLTACLPGTDVRFPLPLNGVTLIESTVDGRPEFPVRGTGGVEELQLEGNAPVGSPLLPETTQLPMAAGPDVLSRWNLHRVVFTARLLPRAIPGALQISAAVPPSVETRVIIEDRTGRVTSIVPLSGVSVGAKPQNIPWPASGQVVLHQTQVRGNLNLILNTATKSADPAEDIQHCAVVCQADLSPARQRLTLRYRVRHADPSLGKVLLQMHPDYRITRVETLAGGSLPWNLAGDQLTVTVPVTEDGTQDFLVQLLHDPATSLQHSIPVQTWCRVNHRAADTISLIAVPADRFVVSSIAADGKRLTETESDDSVRSMFIQNPPERVISVPKDTKFVEIQLSEVRPTPVAKIVQTADVQSEQIDWTALISIDLSGRPAFRQTVRLSPELQVYEVRADSDRISLLQTWSRHGDTLVLVLREAARNELKIRIRGRLRRSNEDDTSLPVVQPGGDGQITESVLSVTASSDTDEFIASAGAATANESFDLKTTPIPTDAPLVFSISDESQPMVIRRPATRIVEADVVAILFPLGPELRVAQYLLLRTPATRFDIRFSCPSSEFGPVIPLLIRDDDVETLNEQNSSYIVPRQQPTDQTVVCISDQLVDLSTGRPMFSLPRFEAPTNVHDVSVYDLRQGTAPHNSDIPTWALNAAEQAGLHENLQNARRLDAKIVNSSRRMRIHAENPPASVDAGRPTDGQLHLTAHHRLLVAEDGGLSGESGILVYYPVSQILKLSIDNGVEVTQLRVNGKRVAAYRSENTIECQVPGGLALIECFWLSPPNNHSLKVSRNIPLPVVQNRIYSNTADLRTAAQRLFFRKVLHTCSHDELIRQHAQDLAYAASLAKATTRDADSAETANGQTPTQTVWQQIRNVSPETAAAGARFFEHTDAEKFQGETIILPDGEAHVTISFFTLPAQAHVFAVAGSLLMLLTSITVQLAAGRSAKKTTAAPATGAGEA